MVLVELNIAVPDQKQCDQILPIVGEVTARSAGALAAAAHFSQF